MKTIKFDASLIPIIESGRKVCTRRPIKPSNSDPSPRFEAFDWSQVDFTDILFDGRPERGMYVHACHPSTAHMDIRHRVYCKYNVAEKVRIEGTKIDIRITAIGVEWLRQMTTDDARREGFDTLQDFIKAWDSFYGDTEFAYCNNPLVWVIWFEVVK